MILENGPKTESCDSGIVVLSKHSSEQTQKIPELLLHKTKKSLHAFVMAEALHKMDGEAFFSEMKQSYKSTWHALQTCIVMECVVNCDSVKSASAVFQAAAYALAHCSSHRTLHPERSCSPFLGGRPAYQNASLDISNFAQTRAEAALAVRVACCISHLERIQNPAMVKSQWQSNQFAASWSHKWELNT